MHHLFIPASNPPHTLKQLLITLITLALAFVAVDRLFGAVIPLMTIEPPYITRFQNVSGIQSFWNYSDEGIVPVVFTGSSTLHVALAPHLFEAEVKKITGQSLSSVNMSFWSSIVSMSRDVIVKFLLPSKAKVIIYGVEMRALFKGSENATSATDFRQKPFGFALAQSSPLERDLLLWLLRYSPIIRYRDNLTDWLTGQRTINNIGYTYTAVDDRGYFDQPGIYNRDPISVTSALPFDTSEELSAALSNIALDCQAAEATCIFLSMPFHELAYTIITPADTERYLTLVESAAAKGNIQIWNFDTQACRDYLGDESFFNLNHVNDVGARKFSKITAQVYAQQLLGHPMPENVEGRCVQLWNIQ